MSTAHEADDFRADRLPSAQHVTDVKSVLNLRDDTEPVPAAQLWDFLQPDTLDYGYMFAHDANGEKNNESIDPQYPIMADSNPYIRLGLLAQLSHEAEIFEPQMAATGSPVRFSGRFGV